MFIVMINYDDVSLAMAKSFLIKTLPRALQSQALIVLTKSTI